ncbi:MAG: hypothetical protein IRY99_10430 [Isosphaeraceae bacterium]|nr:hypothetical protein [Isosphaeraceae bacterium]
MGAVCLALFGCGDGAEAELKAATSLKIGYTLRGRMKPLTISDAHKVQEFLSTIRVMGVRKDMLAALDPAGTVDFYLPGGKVIKTVFVKADQLDRAYWG